jgi:hypothetical protein
VHARLFRGGAAYAGGRLARAATPERVLRARLAVRREPIAPRLRG